MQLYCWRMKREDRFPLQNVVCPSYDAKFTVLTIKSRSCRARREYFFWQAVTSCKHKQRLLRISHIKTQMTLPYGSPFTSLRLPYNFHYLYSGCQKATPLDFVFILERYFQWVQNSKLFSWPHWGNGFLASMFGAGKSGVSLILIPLAVTCLFSWSTLKTFAVSFL